MQKVTEKFAKIIRCLLDTLITLMEDIRISILILSFPKDPVRLRQRSPSPGPFFLPVCN